MNTQYGINNIIFFNCLYGGGKWRYSPICRDTRSRTWVFINHALLSTIFTGSFYLLVSVLMFSFIAFIRSLTISQTIGITEYPPPFACDGGTIQVVVVLFGHYLSFQEGVSSWHLICPLFYYFWSTPSFNTSRVACIDHVDRIAFWHGVCKADLIIHG